jgi:hypothetical protein
MIVGLFQSTFKVAVQVTSAWRPQAYQDHFPDIKLKQRALVNVHEPACASREAEVAYEARVHHSPPTS